MVVVWSASGRFQQLHYRCSDLDGLVVEHKYHYTGNLLSDWNCDTVLIELLKN